MLCRLRPISGVGDAPGLDRTDATLVAQLESGQTDALGALFDRYGPSAWHLAHRMLREAAAADDVVQEVFLLLWTHPGSAPATSTRIRAWLLTTVRQRCRERQRGFHSESPPAGTILDPRGMPGPFDTSDHEVRGADARSVLDGLATSERLPLELMFFDGWTPEQVAAHFGVSAATIHARLRLTLGGLRTTLGLGEVD